MVLATARFWSKTVFNKRTASPKLPRAMALCTLKYVRRRWAAHHTQHMSVLPAGNSESVLVQAVVVASWSCLGERRAFCSWCSRVFRCWKRYLCGVFLESRLQTMAVRISPMFYCYRRVQHQCQRSFLAGCWQHCHWAPQQRAAKSPPIHLGRPRRDLSTHANQGRASRLE